MECSNKCSSLKNITFSKNLSSIKSFAFGYCNSLTEITLPKSITYLGSGTFTSCKSLTKISIPSSYIEIGKTLNGEITLFNDCKNLEVINVGWAEGEVAGAPWGAPNTTIINYNYTEDNE